MKKNKKPHTPLKKSAPAKAENNSLEFMAHVRTLKALKERLLKNGVKQQQIDEFENNPDLRTISCLSYGQYTVDLGEKEITVSKDKKKKTVKNILTGVDAIEHFAKDNGMEVISKDTHRLVVNTTQKGMLDVYNKLKKFGRIYIYKWVFEEKKSEKTKKPTNNTTEAKVNAKKTRKNENKKGADMRPYYAALRKGGVSKRIKIHNKTLAEKIKKWLKEKRAAEEKNKAAKDLHDTNHRQVTTKRKNSIRKAKKIAKRMKRIEAIQAREKKAAMTNATNKKKSAQKAKKHVQTELNMAA